jgi:hypothetical protein
MEFSTQQYTSMIETDQTKANDPSRNNTKFDLKQEQLIGSHIESR